MTSHFSYIGDLDDPEFFWDDPPDEAFRTGNLPRRLIPREKHESLHISAYFVMQLIKDGRYVGRQIDWSAWGMKMTGVQLQEFWNSLSDKSADHPVIAKAIAELGRDTFYILVVAECA
jgi:hypothetical protein